MCLATAAASSTVRARSPAGTPEPAGATPFFPQPFWLRPLAELGQSLDPRGRRSGWRAREQPPITQIEPDGAHHAVRRASEHGRTLLRRLHAVGTERPVIAHG